MVSTSGTFKSNTPFLKDILEVIHNGKWQLPDFQRGWVWDDEHIRDLIASISLSYPIGAVMLFETGGEGVRFRPRLVEGVEESPTTPEQLILDGQQRLTSLYYVLRSGEPVPTRTKGKDIKRFYYLDIEKCLDHPNTDRLDAVIGVPPNRIVTSDFGRDTVLDISTPENEYKEWCYPLACVFDSSKARQWRRGFEKFVNHAPDAQERFGEFEDTVIERFENYLIPTIELKKETEKEAVCKVFEKVNTGGVTLTVFELMTATFAADDFSLRDDWDARKERLQEIRQLEKLEATAFLAAITLFASYKRNKEDKGAVSCKKRDVLRLTFEEYKEWTDVMEDGFKKAARLLDLQKIFTARDLPYHTQLIPLSGICALLGNRFDNDSVRKKLARWFWGGVFGEMYGGANETRYAHDIVDVIDWIEGGSEPRTIRDAGFSADRLFTLQTRNSAAYKGIMALLMVDEGCEDFISGDPYDHHTFFDLSVDIHHIFPKHYCKENGFRKDMWNSVINKTPLSAGTNRRLGGIAPSEYLRRIEKDIPAERLDTILSSHLIEPTCLRNDDFSDFIHYRAMKLLNKIENKMGKTVHGRSSDEVINLLGKPLESEHSQETE